MFFSLTLTDADDGWVGKHNMLILNNHACGNLQSNTPGSSDQRVFFNNPADYQNTFLFWRQWYWT
jgi:hypothetical protein